MPLGKADDLEFIDAFAGVIIQGDRKNRRNSGKGSWTIFQKICLPTLESSGKTLAAKPMCIRCAAMRRVLRKCCGRAGICDGMSGEVGWSTGLAKGPRAFTGESAGVHEVDVAGFGWDCSAQPRGDRECGNTGCDLVRCCDCCGGRDNRLTAVQKAKSTSPFQRMGTVVGTADFH